MDLELMWFGILMTASVYLSTAAVLGYQRREELRFADVVMGVVSMHLLALALLACLDRVVQALQFVSGRLPEPNTSANLATTFAIVCLVVGVWLAVQWIAIPEIVGRLRRTEGAGTA